MESLLQNATISFSQIQREHIRYEIRFDMYMGCRNKSLFTTAIKAKQLFLIEIRQADVMDFSPDTGQFLQLQAKDYCRGLQAAATIAGVLYSREVAGSGTHPTAMPK